METESPSLYALSKDKPYVLPEPELLWPEGLPGVDGLPDPVVVERGQTVYNQGMSRIFRPQLIPFLPPEENRTGHAVVVCPGGGYVGNAFDKEGIEVARMLNQNGIAAFVLFYRDAASPSGEKGVWPEGPLSDALRAIRMVRKRVVSCGFSPDKIGIMGFSSGGHLALTASTLYDSVKEEDPEWAAISARPDFTVAIYPVCSFISEKQHRGSVLRLLGGEATMEQLLRFSPERNVTPQTPPAFLLHGQSDSGVPCENTLFYFQALLAQKVSAELHIFPNIGHGFGMMLHDTTSDYWENLLVNWIRHLS